MPKKYDPDCPYCQAANNYAPSALGLPVAVFSRSQAILHEDSIYLIARSHLPSLDAMRPGERALFEEDRARLTPGLPSAEYTVVDNTYAHYAERFALPALPDDPQAFIADLREAIGHIRERINDPLLVPNLDEKGRVVDWPHKKKEDEQIAIRIYMASKFEKGRDYTEKEVNAVLNQWAIFGDWALLRRELIMYGFLGRYKDGTKYWLESTTVKLI
jgi:hypothetical protein